MTVPSNIPLCISSWLHFSQASSGFPRCYVDCLMELASLKFKVRNALVTTWALSGVQNSSDLKFDLGTRAKRVKASKMRVGKYRSKIDG